MIQGVQVAAGSDHLRPLSLQESPLPGAGERTAPAVTSPAPILFGNHRVLHQRCCDCGLEDVQPWHRSYPCDETRSLCESCERHPVTAFAIFLGGERFAVCGSCLPRGD